LLVETVSRKRLRLCPGNGLDL